MYELKAKKRSEGDKYRLIKTFEDARLFHTMIDSLDPSIYKEAMILKQEQLCMYYEYPKPKVYRKRSF